MTHTTTTTTVKRRTHDIARIVLVVRCTCSWRFECLDDERARREALRHVRDARVEGGAL